MTERHRISSEDKHRGSRRRSSRFSPEDYNDYDYERRGERYDGGYDELQLNGGSRERERSSRRGSDRYADDIDYGMDDSDRYDYRFDEEPPSYRGVGPKGYKRTDSRIEEEVNEHLYDHPQIDASEIEVSVKDGLVTLSGSVRDRATKRQAEVVTEDVRGVKDVMNKLTIKTEKTAAGGSLKDGAL